MKSARKSLEIIPEKGFKSTREFLANFLANPGRFWKSTRISTQIIFIRVKSYRFRDRILEMCDNYRMRKYHSDFF